MTSSSEQVLSQQTSKKQVSPSRRGFIAFVSVALFSTVLFGASVTLSHPAAAQTTPLTALSSTGCTDGTYVNTTNDPRVSGDNNDLVEDCLAIVAIQNSWATSANAGLTSGAALRGWGTGLIATWSGLTVETVSGANRVTELESIGRRRGRFLNTQITGVLPADIGKLTALTKLSLPGNRLSSIPTEITSLTSLSELNLFQNRISGSIPSAIGSMTALTVLNLANNQISGSIPSGIGRLTSLTELSLYNNSLIGGIPTGVGSLTSLTKLFLDNNSLSGTIPVELGTATALTRLQLNDNQLTGSIPTQIGSLTSLTQLYLNDNRLSGSIPTQLGSLTSLTRLHLDNNRLTGTIPTQLGSLTSLTHLHLNNNELSGAVPTQLTSLSALTELALCSNKLTDNLPNGLRTGVTLVDYPTSQGYEPVQCQAGPLTTLSDTGCSNGTFVSSSVPRVTGSDNDLVEDCVSLVAAYNAWAADTQNQSLAVNHPMRSWGASTTVRLDSGQWSGITVSSNRITRIKMGSFDLGGSIPTELGKLTALQGLDLSGNRLTGSIPTELGSLTQLFHELSLQNNQLSGTIPTQLGSLVLLKEMNLSNNALTGTIPTQLGSLAALRNLNLGRNRLWGSIPSQLSSLSALRQLHLNDNLFSGVLPAQLNSIAAPTNGLLHAVSICNNYLTGAVPVALRTASVTLTGYPTAQGYSTIGCQNTGNPPQPAPQPGSLPTSNIVFTAPTGLSLSQNWPVTIDASSYAADGPYVITCGTPASVSATLTVTNLGNCRYTLSTSSTSGSLSFNIPYTSSGGDTETGTITLTATPRHTISFTAPTGLTIGVDQDITIDLTSRLSVTNGSWTIACSDASSTTNINAVVRNGCSYTLTAASSQGTASFTVTFTSSGGATSQGVITFTVGTASNISFTAPSNLSVNSGSNLTVNAASYASDGSYTISCGDATDIHAKISNISRNGCSYTVTAGSRGGTATFTVPYTSSGGDTHDGQISITINAPSSILFTAPTDLETSVGTTITVDAALYADDGTFTISCGTATSVSSLITINSRSGCSYNITAGNTQGTASFTVPYTSSGSTTATGTISITIGPASDIVFTAPTGLTAQIGVAVVVPAGDYATDGSYTITCADAVQLNPSTGNRETLNLAANNLASISKTDCNYTVVAANNQGATATFTVPYTSSGGDTHFGTISMTISAVTSNIVYTAPTNLAVDTSGTLTISAASYARDGNYTITCGTATESSPLISITSQNGCTITISAGTTTGTATISVRYTSSGGHSLDASITVNVRTPSNIVFTAPSNLSARVGQSLDITATTYATDGSYTITCGGATGDDITNNKISVSNTGCVFRVSHSVAYTGLFSFSTLLTSSGGDTETAVFSVLFNTVQGAIPALDSAGCTDGSYVDTSTDPRVSGNNNDLVEDCLAVVAIQNSWATSSNANLPSTFALRSWGVGKIDTWPALTVATVSGARRVTELESNGRRRGRFSDTRITGGLPADIGKLTALTKLSLSGNRLSTLPTEITNLTSLSELNLFGNRISSSIPSDIGNMTALTVLNLANNQLTGSIPSGIGSLTSLTELSLYNNSLVGGIPSGVGNLTALTRLFLDNNSLSGAIPVQLGNATALTRLQLNDNQLTGSIPTQLGSLTSLTQLYLNDNRLSGAIPTQLGSLTSLTQLHLDNNRLSGSIPTQLGSLTSLTQLMLNNNELSGAVPSQLGSLSALSRLGLCSNKLTDNLPNGLRSGVTLVDYPTSQGYEPIKCQAGPLTALSNTGCSNGSFVSSSVPRVSGNDNDLVEDCIALVAAYNAWAGATQNQSLALDHPMRSWGVGSNVRLDRNRWSGITVSSNRITRIEMGSFDLGGSIPADLGKLTALRGLDLSNNRLSGSIPTELGSLTQLFHELSLQNNQLSGTIPTQLGSLVLLKEMNLSNNALTGTIPTQLGSLAALRILNLGQNRLWGSIPTQMSSLTELRQLHLNDNLLSGVLPAQLNSIAAPTSGNLLAVSICNNYLTGAVPTALRTASVSLTDYPTAQGYATIACQNTGNPPQPAPQPGPLPTSNIVFTAPTGLQLSQNWPMTIDASSYATDGPYVITCGTSASVSATLTVTNLGNCRYTLSTSSTSGALSFNVPYTSSGSDTETGTITLTATPRHTISFTAPTGLTVGIDQDITIDLTSRLSVTSGSWTIACSDASSASNINAVVRNGCSFTLTAASSQGTASFTVAFTSSGGATSTGVVSFTVGAASNISFTAPTNLSVNSGSNLTVNAASYASDGSYTISCGDATDVHAKISSISRNGCSYTVTAGARGGTATFTVPYVSSGGDTEDGQISITINAASSILFTAPTDLETSVGTTITVDAALYADDGTFTISCGTATSVSALITINSRNGCSYNITAGNTQGTANFTVPYSSTGSTTATGTISITIGPASNILYTAPTGLAASVGVAVVVPAGDYATDGNYTITCEDAVQLNPTTRNRETLNLAANNLVSITKTDCNYTVTVTNNPGSTATFTVPYNSTGGDTHLGTISIAISAVTSNIVYTAPTNLAVDTSGTLTINAASYAADGSFTITCGTATESSPLISITSQNGCSINISAGSTTGTATISLRYTSSGGHSLDATISVSVRTPSDIVFTAPTGLIVGRNRTLVIDASSTVADGSHTITCGDATGVDATKMTVTRGTGANACSFTVDPVNNLAASAQGDATFSVLFTSSGGDTETGEFTVNIGPDSNVRADNLPTFANPLFFTADVKVNFSRFASDGDYEIFCTSVSATTGTISNRDTDSCIFDYTRGANQGRFDVSFRSAGGSTTTGRIFLATSFGSYLRSANFPTRTIPVGTKTEINAANFISVYTFNTYFCFEPTNVDSKITVILRGCRYIITAGNTQGAATFTLNFRITSGEVRASTVTVNVGPASDITFTAPTGLKVGRNRTLTIDASDHATDGSYTISCGNATGVDNTKLTSVARNGCVFTVDPINSLAAGSQGDTTFSVPFTSSGGDTETGTFTVNIGPDSTITYTGPTSFTRGRNLPLTIDASSYVSEVSGSGYTITCGDATSVDTVRLTSVTRTANTCSYTITPNTSATAGAATFTIPFTSDGGHSITRTITVNVGLDSALTFTDPGTFTLGRNRTLVIDALAATSGENAAYTVTCADATGVDANKMTVTRSSSGDGCSFTVDPVDTLAVGSQGDTTFSVAFSSTGGATASGTFTVNIGPDSTITTNIPPATGAGRLLIGRNQTLTIDASDYVSEAGSSYTISCSDARNLTGGRLASVTRTANTCSYTITPNTSASSGQATFTVTFTSTGGHSVVRVITVNVGPNSAITLNLPPTSGANRLLTGRNRALVVDAGSYASESGSGYTITCGDATSIDSTRLTSVTHTGSSCSFTVTPISTLSSSLQATNATFTVPYTSTGGATANGTISVKIGPDSSMTFTAPTGLKVGRNRTLVIDAAAAISGEDSGYTITCADATGVDASKMTVSHTGSSCSFTVDPVDSLASGSQGDTTFAVAFTSTGGATASGTFTVNIGPDSTITYSSPGTLTVGRNRTLTIDASSYVSEVSGSGHTITCANATGVDSTKLTSVTRTANSCSFTITPISTLTPVQQGNATFTIAFTSDGGHSITRTITVNVGPDSTIVFTPPASNLAIAASRTRTIDVSAYAADGSYTITCGTITESSALISLGTQNGCNIPVTSAGTMGTATISIPYASSGGHTLTSSLSIDVGATSSIVFNAPTGLTVGTNRTLTIDASDYASDGGYTISCGTATNTAANVPTTGTVALTSVVRDSSGNGCSYTITPTSTQGTATFTIPYTSSGGDTSSENISITVGPASTIVYSSPGTLRVGRNLTLEIDASSYVSDGSYTITCADATGVDGTKMAVTRTANSCTFTIDPVDALTPANQGATTFSIAYTSAGGHSITRSITVNIGPDSALTFTAPGTFTLGRNRTLVIDALAATSGENAAYTVTCADAMGVDANKMTVTRSSSGDGCSFTVDPVDSLAVGSQGDTTFTVAYTSTGGATASGTFTVNIGPDSTITANIPPATGAGRLLIGRNQTLTIDASDYVSEAGSSYTITCSDARSLTGGRLASVTRTANTCSYTITPNTSASSGQATFTVTFTSTGGHSVVRVITVNVGPNSAITLNLPPTTGAGRLLTGRNRALVVDAGSYASESGSGYTITCGDATSIDSTRLTSVTRTANTCSFTVTPISTLSSSLQATNATFTVPYTSSGGATATGTISVKIGPDSSMTFTAPTGLKVGRNRTLVIDAAAAISGEDSGYTITCGDATGVDTSKMAVTHTGSSCSFTVDPVNNLASGSQGDTTFSVAFTSTGGATASGTFTVNIGPDSTITYSSPGTLTVGRNRTLTIDASSYVSEVSGSGHTITCGNAAGIDSTRLTSVTRTANTCSFTITPISTLTPAQQGNATFTITFTSDGGHSITRTITVNVGPDSTISFMAPASNLAIAASRTRTIDVSAYASDGSYTITCGTITESSALISLGSQSGCSIPVTSGSTMGTATISIPYASSGGHTLTSSLSVDVGAASSIVFNAPTGLTVGTNRTLTIDASDYASDGGYTITCGTATNTGANVPTTGTVALTSVVRDSSGNGCGYTITPTSTQGTATFTIPYTSAGGDTANGNISITVGAASTISYSTPGTLRVGRNLTLEIDASSYVSDGSYTITCADATGVDGTKMTVTRTANTCTFTIDPVDTLAPANQGATTFSIAYTSAGGHSITRSITVNIGPDSALTFTAPGTFTLGRNRTLVIDALAATSGENAAYTVTCADATGVDANKMTVTRSSSGSGCSFTVDPVDTLVTGSQGDTTFSVAYTSTGGATASGTFTVNIGPDSTITYNAPTGLQIGRNLTLTIDAAGYVSEASPSNYTISCSDARNLTGGRLTSVTRTANTCSYTIDPFNLASAGNASFTITYTSTGGHSIARAISLRVGPNSAITFNAPPTTGAGRLTTGRNRALVVDAGSYASETSGSGYTITCGDATSIDSTRLTSVTHTGSSCSFTVTPISTLSSSLQATNATFTVPYTSSGGATATGTISVKIGPDSSMTFTAPGTFTLARNRTLVIDASAAISGEDSGYTITCGDATGVDASKMAVTHTGSSCSFTVDPVNSLAAGSQGDTTFAVAFTSTGGATASGTFTVNIGPDSTITYSSPGTLRVGRNQTLTIDASSYVREVSGSSYTITCSDAAGVDTSKMAVTRSANTCSFTIDPVDSLAPANQGATTFRITYTSTGGHSITRSITVNIGPDSALTFTDPGTFTVGRNRTLVIDALAATSGETAAFTVNCADATGVDTTKMTVTRSSTGNRCSFTVDPVNSLAPASQGDTTFTVAFTSTGGATASGTFTVNIGPDSTIAYTAPTGLLVGRNRTLSVDLSGAATDGSYTVTCSAATNVHSRLLTVTRPDAMNSPCVFTVTPRTATSQGTATFRVPFASTGRAASTGTVSLTVGRDSTIVFSAPDPVLRVGINRTRVIDALDYARDGNYVISCGDATGVDSTKLTSVTRSSAGNGCGYTITPISTLTQSQQGAASFTVPYTSAGGHTLSQAFSIQVGPASTITYTPPAGANALSVANNRILTIDASSYASEAGSGYVISCGEAASIHALIDRIARNGCSYTLTPVAGMTGSATFVVPYTSSGGDSVNGTITVTIGAATEIAFVPPVGLRVAASSSLVVDAASYASDGSYNITCGEATNVSAILDSVSRTGCSYTIASSASTGAASFTVPYTSSGGDTLSGRIAIRVGAAPTASAIVFAAPDGLTVQAGNAITIDASRYASDGANTITCGTATGVDTAKISVANTACSYTATATATATGTASFTVPYSSTGTLGSSTLSGTITITITPASDIVFTAPPTTGSNRLRIGSGNTRTISLASYATDGPYTITCGTATIVEATKIDSIQRNGCDYTITTASAAAQGDTTFSLTYTSTGGDTQAATFTINIGPASNIVFTAPATRAVQANSTTGINAASYARDGTGNNAYTIGCADATNIDAKISSVSRSGCTYTVAVGSTTGEASFIANYTSTGGGTQSGVIYLNITPAPRRPPTRPTDLPTQRPTPPPAQPPTTTTTTTTTTPDGTGPTTTLEPDQPGPRWNTLTVQGGGTTAQQIRLGLRLASDQAIYTWNNITQTWTRVTRPDQMIRAGTRVSFRTEEAASRARLRRANLGGTTSNRLTTGWSTLSIPEGIARTDDTAAGAAGGAADTPAGTAFLLDPELTDCSNQQGIIAIASYSARSRRWSLWLPCHPAAERRLTTGEDAPYRLLTSIAPADTTYIYTRTRQPLTIRWNEETQTYQAALSVLFR